MVLASRVGYTLGGANRKGRKSDLVLINSKHAKLAQGVLPSLPRRDGRVRCQVQAAVARLGPAASSPDKSWILEREYVWSVGRVWGRVVWRWRC